MAAPREILELVARFEQQLDAYKSGQYNETQLRREFSVARRNDFPKMLPTKPRAPVTEHAWAAAAHFSP